EYARRYLPQYVEELEGLAEGSGVPFVELLVPNCGEELTSAEPVVGEAPSLARGNDRGPVRSGADARGERASGDHCTAVAVVSRGRHVVGHNMDWYGIDTANNVLFDLTVPDGTRILGIAGAPYLLMLGMNSHGIANVSNSVHSTDDRVGVPNVFVRRWSLEASSLEEAAVRGALEARARGTNHFLADLSGRLWDLETSATATAFADHTASGRMAHTNHYAASAMQPFEGSGHRESRTRLTTAERLLAQGVARDDDPVEFVARVLRSHEPSPGECLCGHPDESKPPAERVVTVSSMICDLDERRLYACAGPPCENPYRVFTM
ncbi:MAG TPA: C45 family peptidase, partial [Thermoleophilia bacterium]|nr:C45 family peptidase [Thermoleophilia bacterium]